MLSSPAARGSTGERFRSRAAANPCEAQHDLVCARVKQKSGTNAERYSPNPHFGTPQAVGRPSCEPLFQH